MEKTTCLGSGGNDIVHGGHGDDNAVDDLGKVTLEGNNGDDVVQGGGLEEIR